ncbi:conserved hypothetical protein [Beggiatoa sp. PS]|nr:conserved hypothetical protein [Beggiatoa sp. PS]
MTPKLEIASLVDGIPVIDEEAVGFYKLNCMACFQNQGHASGVKLKVTYENVAQTFQTHKTLEVCWSGEMTSQQQRNYADLQRATDHAACAIALLVIREMTDLTAIEQACIGTTVDYYLMPKAQNQTLLVNQAEARLEISGILCQNDYNTVDKRIKEKLKRLKPDKLPTFIVIVEFSTPWVKMVKTS